MWFVYWFHPLEEEKKELLEIEGNPYPEKVWFTIFGTNKIYLKDGYK